MQAHVGRVASSAVTYRADIDGLRAVAIVAVVAYHAGLPGFGGGFVGVDVFFVISGYLITGVLWGELGRTGSISWGNFYARRVRRLLPAMVVVVLATLVIGVIVMVPDPELRWLSQSVVAVATSLSNMFFYTKTSGYFGADADLQPLLNTWSLAVEEQFYLVWPVVLWLGHRLLRGGRRHGRAMLVGLLGAIMVVSFASSIVLVRSNQAAAFYWMPPRLWELAAGGILAMVVHRLPRWSASAAVAMAAAGAAMVLVSVVALDPSVAFPGLYVVPVVLGTVLLIASGAQSGTNPVARVLSTRAFVGVGLLSYSWYLIHWPLLVFARLVTTETDLVRDVLIALGSLGLAALSFRWVEQPFRVGGRRVLRTSRVSLVAGVGATVIVAAAGLVVLSDTDRWSQLEMSESASDALQENRTAQEPCPDLPTGGAEAVDCRFELGGEQTLVLAGDSHALALLPAAKDAASELGWDLEVLWDTACPFTVGYSPPAGAEGFDPLCVQENQVRYDHIVDPAADIGAVITTGRSTSIVRQDASAGTAAAAAQWERALAGTLEGIAAAGVPVLVVSDVPRFELSVPECTIRRDDCAVDVDDARDFRAPVADAERGAASNVAGVRVWDPFEVLCGPVSCAATRGSVVLYRDTDHLSEAGARDVAPAMIEQLELLLADVRRRPA